MSSKKRGHTIIGYNVSAKASTDDAVPTPPPEPMCTSKICTVKAPHVAKAYVSTTSGLPHIIQTIERKVEKSKYDIWLLDIFYTVHWDRVNRPLPPPTKECINKKCPVRARHEAKVYSTNPEKAHKLPVIIQAVQAKANKTWDDFRGLKNFWSIHGPVQKPANGTSK